MGAQHTFSSTVEVLEWVHALTYRGIKPGLARMEWMMERLDHPHRRLKFVHIAGTNGKGSTLTFMRHVMQAAGGEIGTFTSPYLIRFQNRMQVNGQDISDEDLITVANVIRPLADELANTSLGRPTEFEVVTAMAIYYFARIAYPDIVLWEVGLGGRLDSTNIVIPLLSVITNIGYDHMRFLGETLPEIAFEKAGIIKNGIPVVTGVEPGPALEVIANMAEQKKASLYVLGKQFRYTPGEVQAHKQYFSYTSAFSSYEHIALSMKGAHQLQNATVAMMALEILKQYYSMIWEDADVYAGLRGAQWMGRLEEVHTQPLTVIDAAHNPQGMHALAQTIPRYYTAGRKTLLFCTMKEKNMVHMLEPVCMHVEHIIITAFDFPRAAQAQQVYAELLRANVPWLEKVTVQEDWRKAYEQVRQNSTDRDVVLFAGSLYFIAEVRRVLLADGAPK